MNLFKFKSLRDLEAALGTEKECRSQYEQLIWNGNPICPDCGFDKPYKIKASAHHQNYKCRNNTCYRRFNCLTGSVFENSKLPLVLWCKAIFILSTSKKSVSSHDMALKIGVTQKTAWFLIHRIREMTKPKEQIKLEGVIQADETFVGGKNKNRHADKKVAHSQGRSFIDKTPVLGLIQDEIKQVIERPHKVIPDRTVKEKVILSNAKLFTKVMDNTSALSIQPTINRVVQRGSVFVSDEWHGYRGLDARYDHRIVDHKRKEYVNANGDSTNRIEGAWKMFKGRIQVTHVQVSKKHLQRYADEYQFIYNTRHLTTQERFIQALSQNTTRLRYKDLIKGL